MTRIFLASLSTMLLATIAGPAWAQAPVPPAAPSAQPAAPAAQPQRPPFETKKVEGTDNVYIFRNGNHQAMFVVTNDGVIATDPTGIVSTMKTIFSFGSRMTIVESEWLRPR